MKEMFPCGTCLLKFAQNEETFFVKDLESILLERITWSNQLGAIVWGGLFKE